MAIYNQDFPSPEDELKPSIIIKKNQLESVRRYLKNMEKWEKHFLFLTLKELKIIPVDKEDLSMICMSDIKYVLEAIETRIEETYTNKSNFQPAEKEQIVNSIIKSLKDTIRHVARFQKEWENLMSETKDDQSILDLFESSFYKQAKQAKPIAIQIFNSNPSITKSKTEFLKTVQKEYLAQYKENLSEHILCHLILGKEDKAVIASIEPKTIAMKAATKQVTGQQAYEDTRDIKKTVSRKINKAKNFREKNPELAKNFRNQKKNNT